MSPKNASISFLFFLLISLSLSSTFSSAEYDSVYDLLKAYGLPKGIIPEGVGKDDFTFDSDSGKLQINFPFLEGNRICKVTRTQNVLGIIPVYNRVELQATISATVKYQNLVDIKGITATIKLGQLTLFSDIQIVKLVVSPDGKRLRFVSSIPNVESPEFPITDEFDVPQTCEASLTASQINMLTLFGGGIAKNENQDDNVDHLLFYKKALGRRA